MNWCFAVMLTHSNGCLKSTYVILSASPYNLIPVQRPYIIRWRPISLCNSLQSRHDSCAISPTRPCIFCSLFAFSLLHIISRTLLVTKLCITSQHNYERKALIFSQRVYTTPHTPTKKPTPHRRPTRTPNHEPPPFTLFALKYPPYLIQGTALLYCKAMMPTPTKQTNENKHDRNHPPRSYFRS